jgi:hypothetical protein
VSTSIVVVWCVVYLVVHVHEEAVGNVLGRTTTDLNHHTHRHKNESQCLTYLELMEGVREVVMCRHLDIEHMHASKRLADAAGEGNHASRVLGKVTLRNKDERKTFSGHSSHSQDVSAPCKEYSNTGGGCISGQLRK